MDDVVLVTGCSSGMGLHAAVALAGAGGTVVATMRDTNRSGALVAAAGEVGVDLDIRALDVTDHEAAADVVAQVSRDHGPITILVNNAGRGSVGTAERITIDQVQAQLDVNYLAPVNLTRLVLPAMREAGRGRIVTVTSVGGAVGQPFADAYCGAKFAVEGFMQSLAVVMHPLGVWVSVIEPAAVASDFVGNVDRNDADAGPYAEQFAAYLARTESAFAAAQPAPEAGRAIATAATSADYKFRWQTSDAARTFAGLSLADLDGSRVSGFTSKWIESQT